MESSKAFIPKWILILTFLFCAMEIGVSFLLWFSPKDVLETADMNASGTQYLFYMWATRQFALGVILGIATIKKSTEMLKLAYIFFLVMFAGDVLIGFVLSQSQLIVSGIVMCLIALLVLVKLPKQLL